MDTSEERIRVDDDTSIPERLHHSLVRAAAQTKRSGQHRLVVGAYGQMRLKSSCAPARSAPSRLARELDDDGDGMLRPGQRPASQVQMLPVSKVDRMPQRPDRPCSAARQAGAQSSAPPIRTSGVVRPVSGHRKVAPSEVTRSRPRSSYGSGDKVVVERRAQRQMSLPTLPASGSGLIKGAEQYLRRTWDKSMPNFRW